MAAAYADLDFAALMPEVASRLLGAPNKSLSTKTNLRFGSHGSMSIDLAEGSFYDHEAKAGGGVLALIQRVRGADTAGALAWLEAEGLKEPGRRDAQVWQLDSHRSGSTFYSYRDEHGTVLSRVERTPDKRFRQHGPDGRGGFHCAKGCMAGVRRVPYRLPELLAADPERVVFVVEGEKDADRLATLGLVSTCNAEGAGKFRPELVPHFRGRKVVVIADNDQAGADHAADVTAKLRGVAAGVIVLNLPGLPHKGDVSDWLDGGGTVDGLKELTRTEIESALVEDAAGKRAVSATPYVWRDPASMPQRPWLYGRQLLRGSLSVVVAPGAAGKTSMLAGTALALASGRSLLGKSVWDGPKKCWLWNLEDSSEELARLIQAAALHWRISPEDVEGRLFVDSAVDGADLKLATEDRDGFRIAVPIVEDLVAELTDRAIDVLIVDPFVSSHGVNENDNNAIDAVAKQWARIAVRANCAVVLVHHSRKLAGAEVSAESARGAVSLINAARSVIALNKMTEEEATRYGIEGEDRRRFFRAFDDKNNRAPPADVSDWYHLASVNLGNGQNGSDGDSLPVVLPWTPPDTFDGVTVDHLRQVQSAVGAGEWRKSDQCPDWAGIAVAEVLGLDLGKKADKARVRRLLGQWLESGALKEETRKDQKSMARPFIVVGRHVDDAVSTPSRGEVWNGGEVRTPFPTTTAPIYRAGWGGERSDARGSDGAGDAH